MAVNKVIYGGNTVIDLTGDTVTAESLVEGVIAHDKSGKSVTGTNPYEKTATDTEVASQTDLISQIVTALEGKAAGGDSGGGDSGGSGAAIETCTVTIEEIIIPMMGTDTVYYVDESLTEREVPFDMAGITIANVAKGTLICITNQNVGASNEYTIVTNGSVVAWFVANCFIVHVTGDCTVKMD